MKFSFERENIDINFNESNHKLESYCFNDLLKYSIFFCNEGEKFVFEINFWVEKKLL